MINFEKELIDSIQAQSELGGVKTPRIHSPLNDLPTKGNEMIDFAAEIGMPLLEWQKFVAIHGHKVKEDGRWHSQLNNLLLARQNGKSTFMLIRILTGMYVWGENLQLSSAHRLTTSLETFRQMVSIIEGNDKLASEVKKIRWQHGADYDYDTAIASGMKPQQEGGENQGHWGSVAPTPMQYRMDYNLPEKLMEKSTLLEFTMAAQYDKAVKQIQGGEAEGLLNVMAVLLKPLNEDAWEDAATHNQIQEFGSERRAKDLSATEQYLAEMETLKSQAAPPPKCRHGKNLALCSLCVGG